MGGYDGRPLTIILSLSFTHTHIFCTCSHTFLSRPGHPRVRGSWKDFDLDHFTQNRYISPFLTVTVFPTSLFIPLLWQLMQLEDVNWRLNIQMAQSTKSKLKQPNALVELVVKDGEVSVVMDLLEHKVLWYGRLNYLLTFFFNV